MDNNEQQATTEEVPSTEPAREPQQSDLQPGMQGDAMPSSAPPAPQTETVFPTPRDNGGKKSVGAVFGIIIVLVLVVLAGFYFWGSQLNKEAVDDQTTTEEMTAEAIAAQPDPILNNLQSQSTSDEISDIEADLNTTELDGLDQELSDIDSELTF